MSDKLTQDPVVHALDLERTIAQRLQEPNDAARKEVRASMEEWMQLMEKPKVRKQYEEELGELDPKRAEAEMLTAIHQTFPRIASELGYTPDMEHRFQLDHQEHQLQHEYEQAA